MTTPICRLKFINKFVISNVFEELSPDITTVSNTLYNRTSWTTQHALSSDHLPIITTINIRHDYRLQQNRRTFTNYKKADWTQFTEDTESAFAQTTIPTNIHTANRIVSPNNSQTLSSTQHTKQTHTLTEQHTTYKDTTLHSLLLRSKRQ